jgi:PPOX class probable F420-dependent enzyme
MTALEQLERQQYLNLETFRKSGESMKTPVWFVKEAEKLYIRTIDGSGKVKRVHNNGHVNVAACKVDGTLLSEWMPAQARHVKEPDVDKEVARLINKKYGLIGIILSLNSRLRHTRHAILEIMLIE